MSNGEVPTKSEVGRGFIKYEVDRTSTPIPLRCMHRELRQLYTLVWCGFKKSEVRYNENGQTLTMRQFSHWRREDLHSSLGGVLVRICSARCVMCFDHHEQACVVENKRNDGNPE